MPKVLRMIAVIVLVASPPAFADSLVYNGHISGKHTDLLLTKEQIAALNRGQAEIALTEGQRQVLRRLPKAAGVTGLRILCASTKTCTSELHNVAIRVGQKVEVANDLLSSTIDKDLGYRNSPPTTTKSMAKVQTYKDYVPRKQGKREWGVGDFWPPRQHFGQKLLAD